MRKFICDRCGKECEGFHGIKLNTATGFTEIEPNTYIDLCDACQLGLEQYLSGLEVYLKGRTKECQ